MRRIVTLVCLLSFANAALAQSSHWVNLFPDNKPLEGWQTDPSQWIEAKDASLDPKNPRRLVPTEGTGVLINGANGRAPNLVTKQNYDDLDVHVEYLVGKGSNAGVKLMGVYEIQLFDSFNKPVEKLTGSDNGGVYPRGENRPRYHTIDKGVPPSVNPSKAPGEWQTLDIEFQAPRFDKAGKKLTNARFLKVTLNGQLIHEDVELKYPTGSAWRLAKEKPTGPLLLQADHGPVAYRNVRVRPLQRNVDTTPQVEPRLVTTTHTYKTVGTTKLQLDVHRPNIKEKCPCVVWIHGGALITGSRTAVPKRLLDLCRREGFALVSLDYRLAPETKSPEIYQDIIDSLAWLRKKGPELGLDPDRMVVTGGSAGGHLTLVVGYRVRPAPRALVAYWGYGDIDGDWLTKPSEFYRTQRKLIAKEEAEAGVGSGQPTGTTSNDQRRARGTYYMYLRQQGLWTRVVTGLDPEKHQDQLDALCPIRNVDRTYPPTLLIHGTEDTDVPYEQSEAMAKELAKHKIPHQLVTVPEAGHGLAGGDKRKVEDAHLRAETFIIEHLLK